MSKYGICSEYDMIHSVALSCPELNYSIIKLPKDAMHYERINYKKLLMEFKLYYELLCSLNIIVYRTEDFLEFEPAEAYYNMMFSRDLAVVTNRGVIISNMKYEVRKKEPVKLQSFFKKVNIPVLSVIAKGCTMEGADVLWVKEDTVLIGTGNRTDMDGFNLIKDILKKQHVKAIPVRVPNHIQHLLGVMNVIAKDTVLLRTDLVDKELYQTLKALNYKIIPIKESEEVANKQAMNIVTVKANEIIMPDDCPNTEKIYRNNGIRIHKTPIIELRKGAGGLGCATLILKREKKG